MPLTRVLFICLKNITVCRVLFLAVKLGILTWKYRDRCFWSQPQVATTGTAAFGPDMPASFFCAGSFSLATESPCCRVKFKKGGHLKSWMSIHCVANISTEVSMLSS